MATDEENGWRAAAAADDGGKGISLEEIDPDDKEIMSEVYAALEVRDIGAKLRLEKFIRKLRSEFDQQLGLSQQQQQQRQRSTATAAMTTPWYRIDEEYRTYLENAGYEADEFNDPSFDRARTFNAFNAFMRQQQQLPFAGTRYLHCRMWAGDNKTVFEVPATSFEGLCSAVREKFYIPISEAFSLYFIPNKRGVDSRQYIANDSDLNNFFGLAGKPTVFIWHRGDPSLSPNPIPSEVEIHAMSVGVESRTSISSTSGDVQDLFRKGVLARDKNTCVISGTKLRPKTGNVQAAHILGVEISLEAARSEAGVFNDYDTSNGMLLESSLHSAFDSFQWCMDEFLNVHVTEVGKANGLGKYEGQRLNL